jgi:hypothetical protein
VKTISITRAAVAFGAVVVAGAFGAGYAPSDSVAASAAAPDAAVGHTFGAALRESLALKQDSRSRMVLNIRQRRIE